MGHMWLDLRSFNDEALVPEEKVVYRGGIAEEDEGIVARVRTKSQSFSDDSSCRSKSPWGEARWGDCTEGAWVTQPDKVDAKGAYGLLDEEDMYFLGPSSPSSPLPLPPSMQDVPPAAM